MKALGGLIYQRRLKELSPCSFAKWQRPGAGDEVLQSGNSERAWEGVSVVFATRGIMKERGDFKKEKHEAPHTSFLDNAAAE